MKHEAMSKKGNPRKVPASNLHGRPPHTQPPPVLISGSNQLYDPLDIFTKNGKSKEPKEQYDREWKDLKEPKALAPRVSNRGLDRSCCVKPQLKDVGQLTQSQPRDDKTKPGSARPYRRSQQAGFLSSRGYPRHLSPSPIDGRGVPYSSHASPLSPTAPNLTTRPNTTSHPPPHTSAVSRYMPLRSVAHRCLTLPRTKSPVRHPKGMIKIDQWNAKSKVKLNRPATPGGTTMEELQDYIATSGTGVNTKPDPPKVTPRDTIEELKQYLETSGSFEISRAQRAPVAGNVPTTPGPPNVTPKTSFDYTDTSDIRFETPKTSPLRIDRSLDKVEKIKPIADQLQALKKLLCTDVQKVQNSSQLTDEGMVPIGVATSENLWQVVESVGDVAGFLDEDTMTEDHCDIGSVAVSEKPRIKVIAEKFAKYKKNNLELRKLEEKVVCLEYDVYGRDVDVYGRDVGPKSCKGPRVKQLMRAYFSVKPSSKHGDGREKEHDIQFTNLKKHFVSESHEDIQKFGNKEIEIIDGHLEENHCYIQDLVKVLHNKKVIETKKNKTALDVLSLYDMAKNQRVIDEDEIHFLNHAQLAEVKEMILKTCQSSTHAINRRKIHYEEDLPTPQEVLNVSKSIINELFRESRKL